MGYAQNRTVPLHWVWLGVILTLLESWNAGWTWAAPNILLSLSLVRLARGHVDAILEHHGWAAFACIVCALVAVLPVAANIVDYGAEGWLWALFGLCQRRYVDKPKAGDPVRGSRGLQPTDANAGAMRLLASLVAAAVYIWQEHREFSFSRVHLALLIVIVAVEWAVLCLFRRGTSGIQPPRSMVPVLRFMGRHTLEIYAIQLGGSELMLKLLPDLAP
jgi:hypothetical protein